MILTLNIKSNNINFVSHLMYINTKDQIIVFRGFQCHWYLWLSTQVLKHKSWVRWSINQINYIVYNISKFLSHDFIWLLCMRPYFAVKCDHVDELSVSIKFLIYYLILIRHTDWDPVTYGGEMKRTGGHWIFF